MDFTAKIDFDRALESYQQSQTTRWWKEKRASKAASKIEDFKVFHFLMIG
jgi:hypothetical protein